MKRACICGCGKTRGLHKHHVVYQQKLREVAMADHERGGSKSASLRRKSALCADARNIVLVGFKCHAAHHNRSKPLPLRVLPDSVFEFAVELMGRGAAYEYLRRRYGGEDWRLDELIAEAA